MPIATKFKSFACFFSKFQKIRFSFRRRSFPDMNKIYHDDSYQYSVLGYFGLSGFSCKEPNALFSDQYIFISRKKSIDTLMEEVQPVILRIKEMILTRIQKLLQLPSISVLSFRCKKRFPKYIFK